MKENIFTWVTAILCLVFIEVSLPLPAAGVPNPASAQIAADIAAGKDIALIIREAVAGGMTVAGAVEAVVNSGVDPGRVVYIAITANYSAESVVQGAVTAISKMGLTDSNFLTALTGICSSALQAGADDNQIARGAANAGTSDTVIANAIAQARANPSPVFGYSAPATAGPAVRVGGGGGPIGGSGFGSQSRQASPYRP